jgi:hypothetical protein
MRGRADGELAEVESARERVHVERVIGQERERGVEQRCAGRHER